jgi:excinuclease UvrABC nuclease subunit
MNYIYLNKNIIINLLIFTFTIIILFQIYRVKTISREGLKVKIKKPKIPSPKDLVNEARKAAEEAAEAARKAAEEAARLAELEKIRQLFMQFIKGLDNLFDSTTNTLNFIKNF